MGDKIMVAMVADVFDTLDVLALSKGHHDAERLE